MKPNANRLEVAFIAALLVVASVLGQEELTSSEQNKCIFGFKTCGSAPSKFGPPLPVPCQYDGQPQVVKDLKLLEKFDQLCPSLNVLGDKERSQGLCCSEKQLEQFLKTMHQAKVILGKCPSCLINFSQLFCDLSCSPRQAEFVKLLKTKPYKDRQAVESIEYTINEQYVNGFYSSCQHVVWPALKVPALNVLCGNPCSPHKLVEHLGSKGLSPFDIKYKYTETKVNSFVPLQCNSTIADYYDRFRNSSSDFYNSPCSGRDCPAGSAGFLQFSRPTKIRAERGE